MSGDLGLAGGEVHDARTAVLDCWFGELTEQEHFAKDDALDATITERFGTLRTLLLASAAAGWRR